MDTYDARKEFQEYSLREEWKNHKPPEYFKYREQWVEVPRDKIELDFPIHVDIETTDVCNLLCPMCPRTMMEENGEVENRMMTREEYAAIIDESVARGAKSIKLNYNGEPLSHRDIFWQIEYAKKAGIIDVLMNSNGTLLDKRRAEGVLKAGLDGMFVSIDAVSPDLYAVQRVGATIGKVIDNLYEFVNLRNKLRPGCQVRISMVMYDDPIWREQFEGLRIMWGRLVDSVGYSPLVEFRHKGEPKFPEVPGWWCPHPFQRIVLKVNGNVTVCCHDSWDELKVGDWRKEKLYDIWHSEGFRSIRKTHADGKYHSIDLCSRCAHPCLEKKV